MCPPQTPWRVDTFGFPLPTAGFLAVRIGAMALALQRLHLILADLPAAGYAQAKFADKRLRAERVINAGPYNFGAYVGGS